MQKRLLNIHANNCVILLSPSVGSYRTGATGKVMAGVELKINNPGPNEDGELCFRGRHVFMGYLREERKTREAIDEDGWLHSGDIGRLDQEGEGRGSQRKKRKELYN